jgi:hypothetical protein
MTQDSEKYCKACMTYHTLKDQLWLYREDKDRVEIVCMKNENHLAWEDELEE